MLNEQVALGKGQIVHFYGDGCLATFENSIDAARAATTIQQQFAEAPAVPVRLGLHSGIVNIEQEHVYGNAVNLASRIESLGIPGSILLSKRVRDDIFNQPDFLLVSLGSFAFKNVEEPMEVFALANEGLFVPKRAEIKGKLQPNKGKNRLLLASLMAVLLVAAGWFFWNQRQGGPQLAQEIREARIGILPFENKTNDPELDMLGDMAADWIVQALMSLDDYKVVSSETVREHLPVLANSPATFLQRTGAEKIIRGSFYRGGEDLIIQTRIVDTESGEIEFASPEVSGPAGNTTTLVKDLRERILSYLVASSNPDSYVSATTQEKPPIYEAYQAWMEGRSLYGNDYDRANSFFSKAIEIDPEFFWPYLDILIGFTNQGRMEKADSMLQLIDRRFDRFFLMKNCITTWPKRYWTMTRKLGTRPYRSSLQKTPGTR